MPKRVVGILILAGLAGLSASAAPAQQTHGNSKTATQPAPPPTTPNTGTTVPPVKVTTVSHDVCAKHPNLKQCS